jgi:hypothetical protein
MPWIVGPCRKLNYVFITEFSHPPSIKEYCSQDLRVWEGTRADIDDAEDREEIAVRGLCSPNSVPFVCRSCHRRVDVPGAPLPEPKKAAPVQLALGVSR